MPQGQTSAGRQIQTSSSTILGPPTTGYYGLGDVWEDMAGRGYVCISQSPLAFVAYDRGDNNRMVQSNGVTIPSTATSLVTSVPLNLQVSLACDGGEVQLSFQVEIQISSGAASASNLVRVSLVDITAGVPGSGGVEVFRWQTFSTNRAAGEFQNSGVQETKKVPPAGTNIWALYGWNPAGVADSALFPTGLIQCWLKVDRS